MTEGPLSYCADVHAGGGLAGVIDQLDRYAEAVRRAVPVQRLGLGLRLSAPVAAGLAGDRAARRRLRAELNARGLEVVTLNTFDIGPYRPSWSDPARLRYTTDCAAVLADLLPDRVAYGSVTTLPLGWRTPWRPADDDAALAAFDALTGTLRTIDAVHGRPVTLALEPEPGCVLDTMHDAVRWMANRVDPTYIGLCLDTCHLAVSFVDPATAVSTVYRAGLTVLKVQASAALHVAWPRDPAAKAVLTGLLNPRGRQQVREQHGGDGTFGADDLPAALAELPGVGSWRIRQHVPLHARPAHPLRATTGVLRAAVDAVRVETGVATFPQVEVEVDPFDDDGFQIAADLAWVAAVLDDAGVGTEDTASTDDLVEDGAASLSARSLGGPMTRVGGAWVGR